MSATRLAGFSEPPVSLTLVRHGESVGNLADSAARERQAPRLDLDIRDADVELSENGQQQAQSLGRWFAELEARDRATLVITSPYRRAEDTARLVVGDTGVEVVVDERLRERDLGVLDGLTRWGIEAEYAAESERWHKLGKFYYQPPSGESWADVVLRVRSLLQDVRSGYGDSRLWLVTHQAVIMSFRYVLEGLRERELLDIDREHTIGNCSLTRYLRNDGHLELDSFADTEIVESSRADVTHEPPVAAAKSGEA